MSLYQFGGICKHAISKSDHVIRHYKLETQYIILETQNTRFLNLYTVVLTRTIVCCGGFLVRYKRLGRILGSSLPQLSCIYPLVYCDEKDMS
jgi:hypothetical protein